MKKLLCLILTVTLLAIISSSGFAETEIPDQQVPGAPSVNTATYDEPNTVIEDEGTPQGGAASGKSVDSQEISDEAVPKAPLPKTGGIPAEAFYITGALIIAAALILSRKKAAASKD